MMYYKCRRDPPLVASRVSRRGGRALMPHAARVGGRVLHLGRPPLVLEEAQLERAWVDRAKLARAAAILPQTVDDVRFDRW